MIQNKSYWHTIYLYHNNENLRAPPHREELNVSYEEALHKQRNQYDEDFVSFSSFEFPERLFHIAKI